MKAVRILYLFSLWSVVCQAEFSASTQIVQAELPQFFAAARENLGVQRAELLFQNWTPEDRDFFRLRMASFFGRAIQPTGPVPSPGYLVKSRSDIVFGLVGELFGSAYARQEASRRDLLFMNDEDYRLLNRDSFRFPDGITYDATNPQELIIHRVMESKVGTAASYSQTQAQGYLNYWRGINCSGGMTVPVNGRRRYYPPKKIFFLINEEKFPIGAASVEHLQMITLLVSHTKPVGFRGKIVTPPFTPNEGRRLVAQYLTSLVAGREIDPARKDDLPMIGNEEMTFSDSLRDWILETGHWPRPQAGAFARYLASEVEHHHGQSEVFIYYLDDQTREILFENKDLPAAGSMTHRFRRVRMLDPQILLAARYFIDGYFRQLTPEKAFEMLIRINPIFTNITAEELPSRCPVILRVKSAG